MPVSAEHVDLLREQAVAARDPLRGRALAVAVEPLRAELLERDAERVVGAVGRLDAADDVEVADPEAPRLHLRARGLAGLRAGHEGGLAERAADGADSGSGHLAGSAGGREIGSAEARRVRGAGYDGLAGGRRSLGGSESDPGERQEQCSADEHRNTERSLLHVSSSLGRVDHARTWIVGRVAASEIDGPSARCPGSSYGAAVPTHRSQTASSALDSGEAGYLLGTSQTVD